MNSFTYVRCVVDVLGKLWASPCTVLGLSYGLLANMVSRVTGSPASVCIGNNAIQFTNSRGVLKGTALVLGNVIIYGREACPDQCGAYGDGDVQLGQHEQAHTYQYQVLGPLFVFVYFLAGGLRGPTGNPFERAAQRFGAGHGSWWPG